MGNDSNPILLTASGTTILGSVFLYDISINKTLVGTLTISDTSTAIAAFAIGTPPGDYMNIPSGARFGNLSMILSGADNVTVFVKKS